jgi:serine phosphatase RsbU (regulator of sigma subunit)
MEMISKPSGEERKEQQFVFLAAADCTGHGVPGALVSVVCSNALNRAVKEFNLRDTGQILDKTRELVVETFSKSEEEVKDGMDISLCCIPLTGDDDLKIQWSGANNPLWISRKENPEELVEVKGDKQPIGYFPNSVPFTTHSIDLKKGDSIYLFTDGFQDQFGESSGKKFKSAQMRKLFVSLQEKSMEDQKAFIERSFKVWKGNFEQVDDVCIIGVRL